jgi:phenylpyruvate tautomerase PptA (4-oxalocrotonate tautomerase family)
MPILDVEIVLGPGESTPTGLCAAIADAAAAVFRTPAGHTWVRLRELPQERYAEDGGGPGPEVRPVFVHVLKAAMPPSAELEQEVSALAAAVARVCHRDVENVHIVYEPPGAGRIAFGGRLVR